jgi:phage/plasmid-associated DNA primase
VAEPTIRQDNGDWISLREFIERTADERWQSHLREHEGARAAYLQSETQHRAAHDREHALTGTAISKAEEAVNRALLAAKEANDKRFESVNEFRAALGDAASKFVQRDIVAALEKSLIERMERSEQNDREARSKSDEMINRRLAELERSAANLAGRMWALGVVLAIAMALLRFLPGGG